MPIPVSVMSDPGRISAATMGNAAELISPGTVMLRAVNSGSPEMAMAWPPPSASETRTSAPKCRSMFSEWSRVPWGSITVVVPGVLSPASRMADFTCAEATGSV